MKQYQVIQEYITANPHVLDGTYEAIAQHLNVHNAAVQYAIKKMELKKAKKELKKAKPEILPISKTEDKIQYSEKGGVAEVSVEKSLKIKSLEELIRVAKIDLSVWEIERYVTNKWETTNSDGISFENWQVKAWMKKLKIASVASKNIAADLKSDLIDLKFPAVNYLPKSHGNLFVPNIYDLHLGKMAWGPESGEDYDLSIAKLRFNNALDDLMNKASGYNIERIMFPVGNDLFNSDKSTPFPQTTGGTPQQDDTRYQKLFREARILMVEGILKLSQVAPVDVVTVFSNHDEERGFYLGEVLDAVFINHTSVRVDNSPKNRKYYQFGKCLIATAHGHGVKDQDLPLTMAQEAPEMWADTWYREFLLGHIHHSKKLVTQIGKDYRGVFVTYMTSPSATDSWHYKHNLTGSIKGAEGFIYNKEEGKIGSVIHNIK